MRAQQQDVRCKDVFVPAHSVFRGIRETGGPPFPGLETHRNPAYRVPIAALGGNGIAGASSATRARRSNHDDGGDVARTITPAPNADSNGAATHRAGRRENHAGARSSERLHRSRENDHEGGTLAIETRLRYKRISASA